MCRVTADGLRQGINEGADEMGKHTEIPTGAVFISFFSDSISSRRERTVTFGKEPYLLKVGASGFIVKNRRLNLIELQSD